MKVLSILFLAATFVAGAMATSIPDAVVEIQLIDSKTNKVVKSLVNGDVIESADPAFNLNAIVVGTKTRSVRVAYGTLQNKVNTEFSAPWAYCANKGPLFPKCSRISTYGTHTVFFTPYSKSDAKGDKGTTMSVTFTIEKPNFDITLDTTFVEEAYQGAFVKAAARWSMIIKNDLPDLDTSVLLEPEIPCPYPAVVDDVFVCTALIDIPELDQFGFSFVEYIRPESRLPITTAIISNAQLKDDPLWEELILQQMGEVLGEYKPYMACTSAYSFTYSSGKLTLAQIAGHFPFSFHSSRCWLVVGLSCPYDGYRHRRGHLLVYRRQSQC
jgi:hypothetical protein